MIRRSVASSLHGALPLAYTGESAPIAREAALLGQTLAKEIEQRFK